MEKIKSYIDRFFKKTEMQNNYDMGRKEWRALSENARSNPADATGTAFLYGYAKGHRAAMAEMKKGGAE